MAFRIPEMVQEITTSSGTGNYSVAPVAGFRSFTDELGPLSPVMTLYTVFDTGAPPTYEINLGTYTSGSPPTLTRAQLLKSSTGFTISWPGGGVTKNVVSGLPGVLVQPIFDPASGGLVRTVSGVLDTVPYAAAGLEILSTSSFATMRDMLDLQPGIDIQVQDPDLTNLGALVKTARNFIIGTGTAWESRPVVIADIPHGPGDGIDADFFQSLTTSMFITYQQTPVKRYFESTLLAINIDASVAAHGLGAIPRIVQATYRCVAPEQGYNVGDELYMATGVSSSGSASAGVWASSTEVGLVREVGSATRAPQKGGSGFAFSLSNASWRAVLRAWL